MDTLFVAPLVEVNEISLSGIIRSESQTVAATVIRAEKGPVNVQTAMDSLESFIRYYGYPNDENFIDWYNAREFFRYDATTLMVTRVVNTRGVNATITAPVSATGEFNIIVKDEKDFAGASKLVVGETPNVEIVSFTIPSNTTNTLTVPATGRGLAGTTGIAHNRGTQVTLIPENSSIGVEREGTALVAGTNPTATITVGAAGNALADGSYIQIGNSEASLAVEIRRQKAVTTADNATNQIYITGVDLPDATPVMLEADTLPTGISANTWYFTNRVSAYTYQLHTVSTLDNQVTFTDDGDTISTIYSTRSLSNTITTDRHITYFPADSSETADDLATFLGGLDELYRFKPNAPVTPLEPNWIVDGVVYFESGHEGTFVEYDGTWVYYIKTAGTGDIPAGTRYDIGQAVTPTSSRGACIENELVLPNVSFTATTNTVALVNTEAYSEGNVANTFNNANLSVTDFENGVDPVVTTPSFVQIYDPIKGPTSTPNWGSDEIIKFVAESPGEWGQRMAVSVATEATYEDSEVLPGLKWTLEYKPTNVDRTFAVAVIEYDRTGVLPSVVFAGLASMDRSSDLFVETVLRNANTGVLAVTNPTYAKDAFDRNVPNSMNYVKLIGGTDATPDTIDGMEYEFTRAWNNFAKVSSVNIALAIDGAAVASPTLQRHIVEEVAYKRRDTVAILSVPWEALAVEDDDIANAKACVSFRDGTGQFSGRGLNISGKAGSYAALYANWKKILDVYNREDRWIPVSGDMAGIYVRNDTEAQTWDAPAGWNRGHLENFQTMRWNPERSQQNDLYGAQINPIITSAGEGTVAFGQKTMQSRPDAFDRVNIRRLFILLEKSIATFAKYVVFQRNTSAERTRFTMQVENFLQSIQDGGGIEAFRVQCDLTNNGPRVRQLNKFVCNIWIKPTPVAEYVILNFIATDLDANFDELISSEVPF